MSLVALINLYLSIVIVLLFAVLAVAIAVKLATTHCNVIWGKRALRYRPKSIAHGILFGRLGRQLLCLSPEEDEGHVIVFGPSGAGKTSALLIPTLRSWQGTALVVDISGDISAHVDMPNKIVFDPTDIDTIPYDVFFSVDVAPNIYRKFDDIWVSIQLPCIGKLHLVIQGADLWAFFQLQFGTAPFLWLFSHRLPLSGACFPNW